MEQAEQLMRYKEYEEAERLAMDASRLKANYGPFDAKPEGLISKINAERKALNAVEDGAVVQAGAVAAMADAGIRRAEGAAAGAANTVHQATGAVARSTAMSKEQVLFTLAQARAALAAGDVDTAEQLARKAEAARLPEKSFGPQDDRAWKVLLEVQVARGRGAPVARAGGPLPQGGAPAAQAPYPTTQAIYDPAGDRTQNAQAAARSMALEPGTPERLPATGPPMAPSAGAMGSPTSPGEQTTAMQLFVEGEQALRDRDTPKAREKFRQAYALREQLDPSTAQRLQDHLQILTAPQANVLRGAAQPKNLMDDAASRHTLLFKQLSAEVAKQQVQARKTMETDPQKALEMIEMARQSVEASTIEPEARTQLLKRVDISRTEIDKYIEQHRAQIDADAQNKEIASSVEARRRKKLEIDDRIASMVNECNKLMEERRYPEAEVVAKRVAEIAPNNPISNQLMWMVKLSYRQNKNQDLIDEKEKQAWTALDEVERSAIPFGDESNPIRFPEASKWKQYTETRAGACETRRTIAAASAIWISSASSPRPWR